MKEQFLNIIYNIYLVNCQTVVFDFFRRNFLPNGFVLNRINDLREITEIEFNKFTYIIIDADHSEATTDGVFLNYLDLYKPFIIFLSDKPENTGFANSYCKKEYEYRKIIRYIQEYAELVTHRNSLENITDSIVYASKLQKSIFPEEAILKNNFSEYFIYNNPRDIVSGDFYWFAAVNDLIFVAVGDCTGHGIPGAFMSVLSVTLLNEIIFVNGHYSVDEILNKLKENIIKTLSQTFNDSETHDGLDIALCAFKPEYDVLEFAGAFNPALVIREKEIIEISADRMPVGIYINNNTQFTKKYFDFKKGDQVYFFSDGYSDQIGGLNSKKLRKKRFLDLLLENSHHPMFEQKKMLSNFMNKWKGINEQIDDMLILGIKI